jgi:hypothetical protein
MKKLLVFLIILSISSPVYAVQKYNPHTNKWETTSEDGTIQYNPHDNSWSYEEPGSQIEYNPHENSWDWAPPSEDDRDESEQE